MKIKELLYKTPEMTEERLLKIMEENMDLFKKGNPVIVKRIESINKYSDTLNKLILKECDLIQEKKSYLTKSQRDTVQGFVGYCMILMTKNDEKHEENSDNTIQEAEIIGDNPNSGENV